MEELEELDEGDTPLRQLRALAHALDGQLQQREQQLRLLGPLLRQLQSQEPLSAARDAAEAADCNCSSSSCCDAASQASSPSSSSCCSSSPAAQQQLPTPAVAVGPQAPVVGGAGRSRPPPAPWQQQLQQERQQEAVAAARHRSEAAAASQQLRASQQAEAWQVLQQLLPFQTTDSNSGNSGGAAASKSGAARQQHKLHKSLSELLRQAGQQLSAAAPEELPAAAEPVGPAATGQLTSAPPAAAAAAKKPAPLPLTARITQLSAAMGLQQQQQQQQQQQGSAAAAQRTADSSGGGLVSPGAGRGRLPSGAHATSSSSGQPHVSAASSSRSATPVSAASSAADRALVWLAADADTDAEVAACLRTHWQQQLLPAAALALQCSWRCRGPRLAFNRYWALRQRHAAAALAPALRRWAHWCKAGTHSRRRAQQRVLGEWRQYMQLQLQLCGKLVRALRQHVLSGQTTGLLMWRLCTRDAAHQTAVRPSLGGLLASILQRQVPLRRLQACVRAWCQLSLAKQAARARLQRQLAAVSLAWQKQRLQQALRFWHRLTVVAACERLALQVPALRPCLPQFDEWLWRHERKRQLAQHAAQLRGRSCQRHCLAGWRLHVGKLRVMRAAWAGTLLHSPEELLRCAMSAFKANWRAQQLQRGLLQACVTSWRAVTVRNIAAAVLRRRITQVAAQRAKSQALSCLHRFARMSQLLSTVAALKQWQCMPLALAHLHAWRGDTLRMTLCLAWWRWRRRALGRLRLRAALGVHMFRAPWQGPELCFKAWRKAAAAGRTMQLQQQGCGACAPTHHSQQLLPVAVLREQGGSPAPTAPGAAPCSSNSGSSSSSSSSSSSPASLPGHASATAADAVAGLPMQAASSDQMLQEREGDAGPEDDEAPLPDELPDASVFACLADFQAAPPWRPLLAARRTALAPRGLQRLTGMRLARAVRDLRELQGRFAPHRSESGGNGLLAALVFVRQPVSPGLHAMVTAELPMNVLWRLASPRDSAWWQRVVGLVQQRMPHPDSWQGLVSHAVPELQDLLHCHAPGSSQSSSKSTGCSSVASHSAAAGRCSAAAYVRAGFAASPLVLQSHASTADAGEVAPAMPCSCDSNACLTSSSAWQAEAAAWLRSLACAEELLATAVHVLLGLGTDSSEELYAHMARMAGAQQPPQQQRRALLQGDLLAWLLAPALEHASAAAAVLALRARARDELLLASLELRARALALHRHHPATFTLTAGGPLHDVQAAAAAALARVEAERDWGALSNDSSDDDVCWSLGEPGDAGSLAVLLQRSSAAAAGAGAGAGAAAPLQQTGEWHSGDELRALSVTGQQEQQQEQQQGGHVADDDAAMLLLPPLAAVPPPPLHASPAAGCSATGAAPSAVRPSLDWQALPAEGTGHLLDAASPGGLLSCSQAAAWQVSPQPTAEQQRRQQQLAGAQQVREHRLAHKQRPPSQLQLQHTPRDPQQQQQQQQPSPASPSARAQTAAALPAGVRGDSRPSLLVTSKALTVGNMPASSPGSPAGRAHAFSPHMTAAAATASASGSGGVVQTAQAAATPAAEAAMPAAEAATAAAPAADVAAAAAEHAVAVFCKAGSSAVGAGACNSAHGKALQLLELAVAQHAEDQQQQQQQQPPFTPTIAGLEASGASQELLAELQHALEDVLASPDGAAAQQVPCEAAVELAAACADWLEEALQLGSVSMQQQADQGQLQQQQCAAKVSDVRQQQQQQQQQHEQQQQQQQHEQQQHEKQQHDQQQQLQQQYECILPRLQHDHAVVAGGTPTTAAASLVQPLPSVAAAGVTDVQQQASASPPLPLLPRTLSCSNTQGQHAYTGRSPSRPHADATVQLPAVVRSAAAHAPHQHQQHEQQCTPASAPSVGHQGARLPTGVAAVQLLASPLAARLAFWQQAASVHGGYTQLGACPVDEQMHQLAWRCLLAGGPVACCDTATPSQQQQQQQQAVAPAPAPAPPATASSTARTRLLAKVAAYMQAHARWRQQLSGAPALAAADKWLAVECEEQVLAFITRLTLRVHAVLLHKRGGGMAGAPLGRLRRHAAMCGGARTDECMLHAGGATAVQMHVQGHRTGGPMPLPSCRLAAPAVQRRRQPTRAAPHWVVIPSSVGGGAATEQCDNVPWEGWQEGLVDWL